MCRTGQTESSKWWGEHGTDEAPDQVTANIVVAVQFDRGAKNKILLAREIFECVRRRVTK